MSADPSEDDLARHWSLTPADVAEIIQCHGADHHLPGRTVYDWRHYLAVIQRKPGALRNGAPFAELPEAFSKRCLMALLSDLCGM